MFKDEEWLESTTITQVVTTATGEHHPVKQEKALLIVLVGADAGRTHVVEGEVVIGRGSGSDVRIVSDDVSRSHARIRRVASGQYELEDLGSKNGTMVNGVAVERKALKFGDKLRIGNTSILMFSQYDELEDQMLQAQRLESIGRLASGVAHDFNNILGAILANVGFLRGIGKTVTFADREVQECLGDIDMAAQRAVQISRQLLGLSRRDEREDVLVDMTDLVHEVVSLVSRTFERSMVVEDELEGGLQVKGDPGQLSQMLMNLCINARDAMLPRGGTLSLHVRATASRKQQPHVEISVSDTGCGIPEGIRRRIFEPFYSTKGKGKGAGLGLSSVLSIVRQHGGDVEVESEEGRGTTFRVYLPLAEVHERSAPAAAVGPAKTQTLRRGMILLVDDEEVFRNSARRLLEGLGYPVQIARDGVEAVQVFDLHKDMIELVILDLVMPKMGGEETLEALRKIDPSVRVLISSGQTELSLARGLLGAGVQGFLQKPYDAATIGDAISRATFGPRKWR